MNTTNANYGGPPPKLIASAPRDGATLKELADWIAYLRADGAPDDAPVRVVTNIRAGIKRAEVLTGDRLASALARRAARPAPEGGAPRDDQSPDV